jgi:nucleoside 2-deoxyribosyltransferase
MIEKIVSGGQTGIDRAALDIAIRNHIAHGGWCPRGRRAEDGRIPDHYHLDEAATTEYAERTRLNVRDSDATLVLSRGRPDGGTALTVNYAAACHKPVLVIDIDAGTDAREFRDWLEQNNIRVLNIAGPRESKQPGVHAQACELLQNLVEALRADVNSKW